MGARMSEKEKLCIVTWDKMAIKEGLSYNKSTDSIYGFETSYTENRQLASYWGTSLLQKSSPINVAGLVNQAISILMSCDFEVVATVCDQGLSNLGIYRDLGATTEVPFFYQDGRKNFTMHDPPHLLKCIRNNLLNHGVYFKNVKTEPKTGDAPLPVLFAQWQHIVDLYKADSEKVLITVSTLWYVGIVPISTLSLHSSTLPSSVPSLIKGTAKRPGFFIDDGCFHIAESPLLQQHQSLGRVAVYGANKRNVRRRVTYPSLDTEFGHGEGRPHELQLSLTLDEHLVARVIQPHQFIPYTSHSGWKKYPDSPMIHDSQTPSDKKRTADSHHPSPIGSRDRRLAVPTDKPLDLSTIPTDEPLDLCTHQRHF
ncbi:hypothetical protein JTE90_025558 [Oedothorax gibbosus]|uniref:Transposable element P transposase-like RNase H domain-containing protein n=1 Tax=Oedothorax gibbosus TaxID=931172 RepID=A0AAV6TVL0_9ARAC|nr:hypothetical protein JTE90_025558 [Oedothorax gibbosus]